MDPNGRRSFFATCRRILCLLVTVPSICAASSAAFAQPQPKVWRIGVLTPVAKPPPGRRGQYTIFFEALAELGYAEGRNITVHWFFADNDMQRLPALAAQLVQQKIDLIATNGTAAARAAKQATTAIPILVLSFGDPVGNGLVKSLSRPEGNITGIAILDSELAQRRLQMLTEIAPGANRIARILNPDNPAHLRGRTSLEDTARKLGREIVNVPVRNESDLIAAFDMMVRERAGALIISVDSVLNSLAPRIAGLALQRKLPWMSGWGERVITEYGLIGYSGDSERMMGRAAVLADKIFKGAKPADIPIEQPTHFNLIVNLKIAKALGITIPPTIMVQATRVIE